MSGPKSFYIFDFDDNIVHTDSLTYIYHKKSGEELALSTSEFIQCRTQIGQSGKYKDYCIDLNPHKTFKSFNDDPENNYFPFLEDLKKAVQKTNWQGPSWQRFVKAISRDRTMAIVTARGHHPDKMREGLNWLAHEGLIPKEPDIHRIYSLTHPLTKELLKWRGPELISSMKKQALHHFIEDVYDQFGHEPLHRFGFSDDDPKNIASTRQKFIDLKQRNPHHSFFLYEARPKQVIEEEIQLNQDETQ